MNRIDLEGRTAVITGGAQGIGRATAERMLSSGAQVTIWDRDRARGEAVAAEIGCGFVQVELTDWDAVRSAAARTEAEMGRVDILVCNAGVTGPNTTVAEYPPDAWRQVVDVDLNGVFYCLKALTPGMRERGYGRVVNVASVAGKEGNPNAAAYSAAKAGVIALTKSLGKELADVDVAVNCITPAAAKTAIFDQMSESHIAYMLSKIPRGRFVEVDEIASMVVWLCSAENSFTTGGVFDISGGRATY